MTKKQFDKLKSDLYKTWQGQVQARDVRIKKLQEELKEAENELKEAKDLKNILEILGKNSVAGNYIFSANFATGVDNMVELSDSVAVYVDDYFGGKVIKQEATKLVVLDESGNATYYMTKQKPDKNFQYKLLRK